MWWLFLTIGFCLVWYAMGFTAHICMTIDKRYNFTLADIPAGLFIGITGPIGLLVAWQECQWGENIVLFNSRSTKRFYRNRIGSGS